MNGVRDCDEKKGLLSSCPKTKEVEEELELKQMWEKEGGWELKEKEGGDGREENLKRNTSSPHNGIEAGKQAGCWVSEQANFLPPVASFLKIKFQGLCSPSDTRMTGVLWESDGCCSGAPCKGSPYKRGSKRTHIKRGQSHKNLAKGRQRTKSL